ncbi:MAG TPA: hypothetical protein VFZ56_12575 [Gemmatimonadaceae bacterium]
MKKSRRAVATAALGLLVVITSGHVGSPDTWFAGNAGPYRVLVHVRAPGVIPGIAEVTVQVEGDEDIREVLANVNRFDAVAAAPPPERAKPVRGQPNTWRLPLWVMTGGSNSVTVHVRGDRGDGTAVVPATIVAFRRLAFTGPFAIGLGVVGLFLFAGAVTIVGSAVRESGLEPGAAPGPERKRAARIAMAASATVLALILLGGKRWWDSEDRAYRAAMFRPLEAEARLDSTDSGRMLRFVISDTAWRRPNSSGAPGGRGRSRFSPLVPDHGKLVHMFVIRDDLQAFAHIHPLTEDSVTFSAGLPPLPRGRYRVFADITHESGYAQTLPAALEIRTGDSLDSRIGSVGDESWLVAQPQPQESNAARLEPPYTMTWERPSPEPIVAGRPAPLRFRVSRADGGPVELEPYMGMPAHAVVMREDGDVFIHLHPMGTISSASQLTFEMRTPADTAPGMLAQRLTGADSGRMSHAMHEGAQNVLSFPYAFPAAGRYVIWVQVKQDGRVLTAAFTADVQEGQR